MTGICEWTEDEDGIWETDCGNMHVFLDSGPDENGYIYCPYCGKKVGEKKYEEKGEAQ